MTEQYLDSIYLPKKRYTIKNSDLSFDSIEELTDFVIIQGICPSAKLIDKGVETSERIEDFLQE